MSARSLISPRAPSMATLAVLQSALLQLRLAQPSRLNSNRLSLRYASHASQGRANKAKQGPGKRLGAKKTAGEYVVPGNILFKQRGTLWYPGDNCYMGRDHTIHAGAPGYVRYYRDPAHPKRKFIGIVFEKEQHLPQVDTAVRRRKLGMLAYQIPAACQDPVNSDPVSLGAVTAVAQAASLKVAQLAREPELKLRPGYQYRQGNWEIGRAADRAELAARARGTTTRTLPDFRRRKGVLQYRKKEAKTLRKAMTVPVVKKQKAKKKARA